MAEIIRDHPEGGVNVMGRPPVIAGESAELCRLTVPINLQERLEALAFATGTSQSWHRRRALVTYLDFHRPAGTGPLNEPTP
jgi:hypothetical protein